MSGDADPGDDLQAVLDALEDPDCRRILRTLDRPMTAQELIGECGISQTTAYRKLDALSKASLVDERTEVRDDGHHATRYVRAFGGVYIDLDDDGFAVRVEPTTNAETPDRRLARFWSEVSEEL